MSFKLYIRETNGVSVVDVSGRVTLGEGASMLRDALRELGNAGKRRVLLNLQDLTYLDSSGIGVLVSSFATLGSLGAQLKLTNLSSRVKNLLLITKLYTVFEVFEDEASAIGSFAEPAVGSSITSG